MINGRADQGESDLQRSIIAKNREIQQQILAVDTADDNLQRLYFVLLIFSLWTWSNCNFRQID